MLLGSAGIKAAFKMLMKFILVSISSTSYAHVFCTNVVSAAFYLVTCTLNVGRKSCRNDVCTKNAPVKCWWNLHWKKKHFYSHAAAQLRTPLFVDNQELSLSLRCKGGTFHYSLQGCHLALQRPDLPSLAFLETVCQKWNDWLFVFPKAQSV